MKKIILMFLFLTLPCFIFCFEMPEKAIFKPDDNDTILIFVIPSKHTDKIHWRNTIFSYRLNDILYNHYPPKSTYYAECYKLDLNSPAHFLSFFFLQTQKSHIRYKKGVLFEQCQFLNNEVIGFRAPLEFSEYYENINKCFIKSSDKVVISLVPRFVFIEQSLSCKDALEKAQKAGLCYILDYDEFQRIEKLSKERPQNSFPRYQGHHRAPLKPGVEEHLKKLLVESSQPITTDTPISANIPILLIDEKNHTQRTDSQDWRIYTFLNKGNGMFYQYATFEKELEYKYPLHVRDFAMDHLAGVHLCKKSTVLIKNKTHEKVVKKVNGVFDPKNIYIHKQNGKQWKPAPVPKDKNTIPKDRLYFYGHAGRLFGSQSKIWDLNIWQMLPNLLRDNPEGVYLVGYGALLHLNECKTYHEEQELLQKTGVLITPVIYKELMALKREEALNPPPVEPIPVYVDPRAKSLKNN